MFSAVIATEDLEEDVVGVRWLLYNGGVIMCDASTLDQCDELIFKTQQDLEKNQKEPVSTDIEEMEEFFIPINKNNNKYHMCERTKSTEVYDNQPRNDVLEAFKLITNRRKNSSKTVEGVSTNFLLWNTEDFFVFCLGFS